MKRREFVQTAAATGAGLLLRTPFAFGADEPGPNPDVKRVLVMFKCHFDAGFIDTQKNVVHKYFTQYFPHAIEIARDANAAGKRRYVWTTGSWLLFEYLEQAQPAEKKAMEEAIERGDIAWHGLPFTWQTEMLSPSLIEGSLALARSLDKRYGRVTTGAKMTDVPGNTRGIIAPLERGGIKFLEIGVNGGSTPAVLPPLFLWKDTGGASLAMMYHHEYGDVAVVPGSDLALVTAVRGDNSGPHTAEEIAKIHADLAARFPNAEITAANLSEMANALERHRGNLPVVTQEIGDTWIYGCASDPLKVSRFRSLARLREKWIAQGNLKVGDETDLQLLRHVLLEAEHTWGTDTKTWLDFDNYLPADLAKMLDTKNYKVVEFSWIEKRQDLLDGVVTLPGELRKQAESAIRPVNTQAEMEFAGETIAYEAGKPLETAYFVISIDPRTGAITRLRNKATGREWASEQNPIALFSYQTLSQEDYQLYQSRYLTIKADWAQKDFGKPNIEKFGAKSQEWAPTRASVEIYQSPRQHSIRIEIFIGDETARQSGRAALPNAITIDLALPKDEPAIHIDLTWSGKPATRMPEAFWLTFNPIVDNVHGWSLDKSGHAVSPFDVVENGNRHMHALGRGFAWNGAGASFAVETIDAPVVALGERNPLYFGNDQPDLSKGIHSCLFNNAWGTNYIMWYGEDLRARYVLRA
ncbi:MAG: DUF5054 domain-containing protein [Terracidiphilus sp.]